MKTNTKKTIFIIIILILISFGIMKVYWFFFGPILGYLTLVPAAIKTCKLMKENYPSVNKILLYILILGIYLVAIPFIFFNISRIFDNKFYKLNENNLKMELGEYNIINEKIVDYSPSYDDNFSFRNKTKETEINFKDALNDNIVIIMDDSWKGKIDEDRKEYILDTIAKVQIKKLYFNIEENQNIFSYNNYHVYNLNNDIKVTLEINSNYNDLIKNYIIDKSNCNYEIRVSLSENYELSEYNIELIKNYLFTILNKIDKCSIKDNDNYISKKIDGYNRPIYDIYYDGNNVYLEEYPH